MPRPEKVAQVDEIRETLTSTEATVLTEYRGLTVTELAQLRTALRESGARYKVYKNTLARRAAEDAGLGELVELLEGPTAFTIVDGDVVGAAKALRDFAKTNDKLVVKGGLLNGSLVSAAQVEELASLPSREELLAKIAGGFKAPMAKAAGLFSGLQRKTAYAIKALIDKRVEGGEEAPPAEAEAADETPSAEEAGAVNVAEAPAEDAAEATEATEATEDTPAETPADEAAEASEPAADAGEAEAPEGAEDAQEPAAETADEDAAPAEEEATE